VVTYTGINNTIRSDFLLESGPTGSDYYSPLGTYKVLTLPAPRELDAARNFGNFGVVNLGADRSINEGTGLTFTGTMSVAGNALFSNSRSWQWVVLGVVNNIEQEVYRGPLSTGQFDPDHSVTYTFNSSTFAFDSGTYRVS